LFLLLLVGVTFSRHGGAAMSICALPAPKDLRANSEEWNEKEEKLKHKRRRRLALYVG